MFSGLGGTAYAPGRTSGGVNRPFPFALASVAVVLLFVLAWVIFRQGMHGVSDVRTPAASGALEVGSPLPDVELRRLNGTDTSLRSYVGHPLLVNFFATWCEPCKAELPEIERRYAVDKDQGLVVLGVDQQEASFAVDGFTKQFGVTYPVAIDTGKAAVLFDLHTIPLSVFVDASGVIRAIRIGQMQGADIDASLATIMSAPAR